VRLLLGLLLFFANLQNPFAQPAKVRVLIFARTDCPITNRYAPELARIAREFETKDVKFWVIYPDPSETATKISRHMAEYHLPGEGILDPNGELSKRAEAKVSPQAAVFDSHGKLTYSGRIDDRFVAFGKARPAPQVHDLENAIAATLAGKPVAEPRTKAIGCYLSDIQ
jgi:hypothetical protein